MDNNLNIRLACGNENYNLLINSNDNILQLKCKIKEILPNTKNIIESGIVLKMGFPPKSITDDMKTLNELKISNNEQLRVELVEESRNISSNKEISFDPIDYSKYSVIRKVIAADNSCLFNAINYAINQCLNEPATLRELIAIEIQSNPDLYNTAILEKDPFEYCTWILRDDTWGGGIELSILSKCFQTRLGVADIISCHIEYFGEDFPNIIYLLYDGIHYDVFVKKENGKENGLFSAHDEKIKTDILNIIKELKQLNKFTDTKNFKIKCNVCYQLLRGNDEAIVHSKSTGHINFLQN